MVTASIDKLKFWITARWVSRSNPRRVHQSVGTVPVKPPMPPSTPPTMPTAPSASRPPCRRGRRGASNISGHHTTNSVPNTALNHSMSR